MKQAWIDCLDWAINHDLIRKSYTTDTGKDFSGKESAGEFFSGFVPWFNKAVWGEKKRISKEMSEYGKIKMTTDPEAQRESDHDQ